MKTKIVVCSALLLLASGLKMLAQPFEHSANASQTDPDPTSGIGYRWTVTPGANDTAFVTGHVGAWSWEDDSLFDVGEEPVGWTHTSHWLTFTLTQACYVTIRHERFANVPWPSAGDSNRVASIANMNPSFTLFSGYDGDGTDFHTYNNHGNISWAEDVTYLAHVNNTNKSFCERVFFLAPGQYTLALGSNASSNDSNRQGYRTTFTTSTSPVFDRSVNASMSDPNPTNGIGYRWRVELDPNDTAFVTGHVGAWSWEDDSLFESGEEPVGWTHTSHWVSLTLKSNSWLTIRHERRAGVPWPTGSDINRVASTANINPSFTLFSGYEGDGTDFHTYNNHGNISWAEDVTYLAHVNNTNFWVAEDARFLPAGEYTIAIGSNASENDTARQGYRAIFTTSATEPKPSVEMQTASGALTLFWRNGLDGYRLESSTSVGFEVPLQEMTITPAVKSFSTDTANQMRFYRFRTTTPIKYWRSVWEGSALLSYCRNLPTLRPFFLPVPYRHLRKNE